MCGACRRLYGHSTTHHRGASSSDVVLWTLRKGKVKGQSRGEETRYHTTPRAVWRLKSISSSAAELAPHYTFVTHPHAHSHATLHRYAGHNGAGAVDAVLVQWARG